MTASVRGPADPARAARRARVEAILVSVALAGNNALSYLLNIIAARLLAPDLFGELSSLLALLVVGVVPAMGLQTVVALRVARWRTNRLDPARSAPLFGLGLLTSATVAAVALLAAPLLVALLHLDGPAPALCLAVALAPLTLLGLFHGTLQGTRRFGALACLIFLEGAGKVGGSLLGLLVWGDSTAALAGAAAGSLLTAGVGWLLCGRPRPGRTGRRNAGEVLHATQAMLALVLLVNMDLVLARHHLPAAESGQYALGAIVTKIAYWLPQAVGVLVLPRLVDSADRRRALPLALAVCAALDAVVLAATALFGDELLTLIGGARYDGATMALWPFALTGSLLALVQILLFARLADNDRRVTVLMWAAVLVEITLVTVWLHGSALEVVGAAALTVGLLAAAGAVVELRAWRRPRTEPVA